ncbi:DNA damage-binding protein CMR1 [Mycena indigotica]|uniref:DNA damage-binding protein CMR1 n=1 Tax=Mycena indigotica TaxID=2126181 RepID=A0A8H6SBN6_9AGAR|nr:DNA damage-binding protein CMR1 [Mycena indigotica]KAF7294880.1 DNA damage-binding protein CMR1 [Mycena indigotica]
MPSAYELEREKNIARNRALLEQLDLKQAVEGLVAKPAATKSQAKPVQPNKPRKPRERVAEGPRRQSARLRESVIDPNESPAKRKRRDAEREERRAKEEEERLEEEEKARAAKRPRHGELGLATLVEEGDAEDLSTLASLFESMSQTTKLIMDEDAGYRSDEETEEDKFVTELREKLQDLKVVARAKVTQDRVYSAAYHPEVTKDLVFFGDKHGSLGIWDARAAVDEVEDEDGDVSVVNASEGKYWRLQLHWPATSKSSISCVKIDPINSHNIYTSAYDCTVRSTSFPSGVSREVFVTDDVLISSIDVAPTGNDMWISDAAGDVWHRDLRQDKSVVSRYGLSDTKIGCLSINPTRPNFLVTSSNSRSLKIWDIRKLQNVLQDDSLPTPPPSSPGGPFLDPISKLDSEADYDTVTEYTQSKRGQGCLRADWRHDKSVSSAYWDPRGRYIVSTSYDDTLRLWDISSSNMESSSTFPSSRPFNRIRHNCQTGKWLTILRAQWSPNPEAYPHFTIGNMDHSVNIFTCKGELITRLADRDKISAVQAVTCSHPSIVERVVSGNASGRCVLWAPEDEE